MDFINDTISLGAMFFNAHVFIAEGPSVIACSDTRRRLTITSIGQHKIKKKTHLPVENQHLLTKTQK